MINRAQELKNSLSPASGTSAPLHHYQPHPFTQYSIGRQANIPSGSDSESVALPKAQKKKLLVLRQPTIKLAKAPTEQTRVRRIRRRVFRAPPMNRLAAISKALSWLSLSCVGIVVVKQTLSQAIGAGVNVRRLTPGQGAHNPQNKKKKLKKTDYQGRKEQRLKEHATSSRERRIRSNEAVQEKCSEDGCGQVVVNAHAKTSYRRLSQQCFIYAVMALGVVWDGMGYHGCIQTRLRVQSSGLSLSLHQPARQPCCP